MTYCRALLRSSAGEGCFLSDSLYIAHNFYKRKCFVISSFVKPALAVAAHLPGKPYILHQRASTVRWALRSLHTVPSSRGRYIAAESPDSFVSNHDEVFEFSGKEDSLLANSDTELDEEDSVCEEAKKPDNYLVINFYVLVDIVDPQLEVARHTAFVEDKDIRGRILISSQGINAQYSGPREDVVAYANWVRDDPRFSSIHVQVSPSFDGHTFPRLKLRYKPCLVQVEGGTTSLPITDPSSRAIPLSSREWKEKLLSTQRSNCKVASVNFEKDAASKVMQRQVLLLDVRNGYEWDVGHFKGAQRPPVDNFKSTEFGLQYNEDKESDPLANVDKENTDVLMYCTGGIRCDVYSTILRQKGFKNLYSLKGGVARYLSEENGENWLGNLFVFDSRLSVPPPVYKQSSNSLGENSESVRRMEEGDLHIDDRLEFCKCSLCGGPLSYVRHRNCANIDCNRLFLCCEKCVSEVKGCCSAQCTSAPRQRPFFSSPQQYKRWHNYRDNCSPLRPAGFVGKRAKRKLRDLEQEQQSKNASLASGGSLEEIHAGY